MKEDQRPSRQSQRELEQLRQRIAELEQATSKQEQTEETLRESEKRYRDLVENLAEVIYAADSNGAVTYVSPAVESLIGYAPSEVIGSHFEKYIHQDDLPRLKENFASILTGVFAENEYRVFSKSGEVLWVRTSSRPTYEGNRVGGVHGVLSNITKWKQTQEVLARRASQLQIIGEVARKASSFLDPDSLLSYVVTAIQQRFGYCHVDVFLVDETQDYAVFETSSSPLVAERRKDKRQQFKVGKEGMIGWVANTGEPLLANDVSQEPRYLPDELLPDIRSELVVPLKVEDQIIGVLDIDSDELGAFDEEDIFVLQTLANQLAIALRNARLYEETRQLAAFNEGIVENVVVGISVEDADGNFTFLNPAAADLLGYPIEELIGRHWTTVVPPDQQAIVQATLKQRLTGMASSYELEIVRKDGRRRCVLVSASPRLEKGRLAGMQTVFTNITAQKQAEKSLAESEARYRGIFENAPFGIWISDEEGTLIFANQATLDLFGVSDPAQLVGYWNAFRDTTKDEEPFRKGFQRAQAGEIVRFRQDLDMGTVEYNTTRKGTVHFFSTLFPIQAGSGGESHIVVIQEDITNQVRAEEEIHQLSQFRESIIDSVNVWLDVLDENGNVLIWNKAAERISGYSREEVVGHDKIWEWLYPDEAYRRELEAKIDTITKGSEILEGFEAIIKCRDGQTKIISWNQKNLLDEKGTSVGSIALGRDVTERKQVEETLRERAEEYRSLVESTEDSVYLVDRNCTYMFMNEKYLSRFNSPIDKVIGRPYGEFHSEEKTEEFAEKLREVFETSWSVQYEHQSERDGNYFLRTLSPVKDQDGRTTAVTVVSKDITRQKRAEEEILKLNQYLGLIIDSANVWLSVLDEKGLVRTWNKAAEAISGYSQEEVVANEKIWEWLYPDEAYRKGRIEKAAAVIEGSLAEFDEDSTIRCKDGQAKIMSWHVRSLHDDTGRPMGFLSIGLDITERKRTEEQLAFMATHDPLTNLPNRQAFNDRLDLELSHAYRNQRQLAVMMLDLDHFKKVNDTLGHSVGDKLLQAVGKRLTGLRRKSDTIARLGGDEFMLILPEITQYEDAERIAQELLQAVREPLVVDGHKLRISTSIGIVLYPEDADNAEALVKNADIAMYRAKEMGRNTYQRYTPQ